MILPWPRQPRNRKARGLRRHRRSASIAGLAKPAIGHQLADLVKVCFGHIHLSHKCAIAHDDTLAADFAGLFQLVRYKEECGSGHLHPPNDSDEVRHLFSGERRCWLIHNHKASL